MKIIRPLVLIMICLLSIPVLLNTFMPIYVIQSDSMFPYLKKGSVIIVHNYQPKKLSNWIGKVVVFYNPWTQKVISHRLLKVDGNLLVTKGDHNPNIDSYNAKKENLLGVVIVKFL